MKLPEIKELEARIDEASRGKTAAALKASEALISCYKFAAGAAYLASALEAQIRDDSQAFFAKEGRNQVAKHKLGDIWGESLALSKLFENFTKLCESGQNEPRLSAELEALARSSENFLNTASAFNNSDLKSEELAALIAAVFSLYGSSQISELSGRALSYINQLA